MKKYFKKIIVYIITKEASFVLLKYKPKIVAVTGNVGKTSTKDAVATVLQQKFFVRKSQKSFNSEIGVPLTILDCPNGWYNPFLWIKNIFYGLFLLIFPNHYPNYLVLEVGTDGPGDIKSITQWLRPDIVVFNKIGKTPVHLEFFKSKEELIEEKLHLVKALKPNGGLVVNGDDGDALRAASESRSKKVLKFGFLEKNNLVASNWHTTFGVSKRTPLGMAFKVKFNGSNLPVVVEGAFGQHNSYALLAAIAVADLEGINLIQAIGAFSFYSSPPGRLRLIEGVKNSFIFDDSYNSSPTASSAALDFFAGLPNNSKKICVLGDMLELGEHTKIEHKEVGQKAVGICDILVTVGSRAKDISLGFYHRGDKSLKSKAFHFDNREGVAEKLLEIIDDYDYILIKGSQGMRMEKIVEKIMKHPEQKESLLVRQEKEWLLKK